MAVTTVVNLNKEGYDVYIGRGSKWGCPFTIIKDRPTLAKEIVATKEEALSKYKEYVLSSPELMDSLDELYGKVLGCFCKPKPCHGDILLELISQKKLKAFFAKRDIYQYKTINMTKVKLTNSTSEDVHTHITLGATEGCIQDVTKLVFSDPSIVVVSEYPLKGYFIHKAKTSVEVSAPNNMGFNGNVSFNTEPQNCKSHELPWGMNVAEFIVNNPFQAPNGQETVDNSCVAGANALIKFKLSADDWTTNGGAIKVKEIVNGMWDKNTGLIGVYPYGCDNCTSSDNPPSCVGKQPQFVQAESICNVQRPCASNEGGEVEIILEGFFEIL